MALASWLVLWVAKQHVRLLRCLDHQCSQKGAENERGEARRERGTCQLPILSSLTVQKETGR